MTRKLKTFAVGVCCVILLAQCDATGELSSDTASGEDVRSGPVLIPVCAVDEDCAEWGPNDPCGVYSCEEGRCVPSAHNEGGACDDWDPTSCDDACRSGRCVGEPCEGYVELWGRVWGVRFDGTTLVYELGGGASADTAALWRGGEEAISDASVKNWECTPWDPSDPYMCDTFSLNAPLGQDAMLSVFDPWEKTMDSISRIFTVEEGMVEPIVVIDDNLLEAVSTIWGVTLDPDKGHMAAIVASRSEADIATGPFIETFGGVTLSLTPSDDLPDDFILVHIDGSNILNKIRSSTDDAVGLVVALNLPPRPFEDPYELRASHESRYFSTTRFAVQPFTLSYVIVSP